MNKYFDSSDFKVGDTVCRVRCSRISATSFHFHQITKITPKGQVIICDGLPERFTKAGGGVGNSGSYHQTYIVSEQVGREQKARADKLHEDREKRESMRHRVARVVGRSYDIDSALSRKEYATSLRALATEIENFAL